MASLVPFIIYLYFHACIAITAAAARPLLQFPIPTKEGSYASSNLEGGHIFKSSAVTIWRIQRSTLELVPGEANENVDSKDNNPVGGVAVIDYEQPHRKPPIHNKGT